MAEAELVGEGFGDDLVGRLNECNRNHISCRILRDSCVVLIELTDDFHVLGRVPILRIEWNKKALICALQIASRAGKFSLIQIEVVGLICIKLDKMISFAVGLDCFRRLYSRGIDSHIFKRSIDHCYCAVRILSFSQREIMGQELLALFESFFYRLIPVGDLDLELTAMDFHLQCSLFKVIEFSSSAHSRCWQDVIDYFLFAHWDFGWLIS